MKNLNKRYHRSIKENLSFYISASILTIVTLLMFYLFYIAGTGINQFGDVFFDRNKLEDAEFSTYIQIPDDSIAKLEEKYDIILEKQLYTNIEEDDFTARVFHSTEKINLYEITEGNDISQNGEIVISEGYAVNNKINIGDKVTLSGEEYEIVGFFQRPDYLYMLESPDDSYKNISTFFLAYLSDEDFSSLGETPLQYFIKYNKDNSTDVRKYINEEYIMQSYLSADENARITMVHEQADMFVVMAYIILFIMPLIAVALVSIILSRKVKSEQKMIGTLSALGYKRKRLMFHYAGFAAIPGIVGGIGTWILTTIFAQTYGEMCLADYEPMRATFKLPLYIGVLGIIVPTVMYVLAAMISVYRLLKHDTVSMLNGTAGQKKKKKLFVNSKMSFKRKYALRSLLGNPARSFVVLLGVFLGSYITLFMFGIVDSVKAVSGDMMSQLGTYKYEYVLNTLKTEQPENGEAVLAAAFEDDNQSSLPLYGVDDDNKYLNLSDTNGNKVTIGSGYYLTSVSATLLNVKAGDTIDIYNPLSLESSTIKIDGILENDLQKGIFTSRTNAESLLNLDKGVYNAILSDTELDLDKSEISETIKVSSISEQMDTIMDEMSIMIDLGIFLGIIICVAAIYVAINMLMTENRNNISMLKVLGYDDKRINSMVLRANHILLPIGILISIPLIMLTLVFYWKYFAGYVGILLPVKIEINSILLTVVITSLCYFGSLYAIRRKTKKIDMVESLKDNRE